MEMEENPRARVEAEVYLAKVVEDFNLYVLLAAAIDMFPGQGRRFESCSCKLPRP